MNRAIVLLLFAVICFCCEKQTPEPALTLNEYIIGDWEVREAIDLVNFGDFEYHSIGPPYAGFYRFKEDQTYEIWVQGDPYDPAVFEVNEKDSLLILKGTPWKLYSFNEMVLDIRIIGGHGLQGHRLYKID